jgi:hypothetical protein
LIEHRNGIDSDDHSGRCVSSAGDVNGDDHGDILIGAPGADPDGFSSAVETFPIFGGADGLAAFDTADGASDSATQLSILSLASDDFVCG